MTVAYWVTLVDREGKGHKLLAFGVDSITGDIERVDISPVLHLFNDVKYEDLLALWI